MTTATERTVVSDFMTMVQTHLQGVEWNFNGTISMLRRRWQVLVTCVGLCLLAALAIILLTPPTYTATSLMQINTRQEQVMKMEDVVSGLSSSDAAIRTEIDVLTSRKLAGRVVDKLHLVGNQEFLKSGSVLGAIKHTLGMLIMPISHTGTAVEDAQKDEARARAISVLQENMDVQMRPRSYSIVISYRAHDPKLAALVANTIAQEYLNNQLEDRFEATQRANAWINERLKQLQQRVQAAERATQTFRESHGLTEAKGVLISEQQISELNSQLILARTQLAEAEARAGRAQQLQASGRGIESAAEVLSNPLIISLREQEAEVRRSMSELGSRYGERHPRMQTVRNQLGGLQHKIAEEIRKIQGSLENNVAVAQARVKTLEEQLANLQEKTSLSTDASVQLAELERQSSAEKSLYESFLNRSKEIGQMDFAQTDARIISQAEVPLGPSGPKKGLIMALAMVLGLGMGVGLMLALEALDSGFRTTSQLENLVNVPVLGLLGELPHTDNPARYVLNKPTGAFSEGIRGIRTALQFANPDKPVKVVMVTSSAPQEGKSLFALSLAQLSAAGGAKTLLIDADLRRPSAAKQLELEPKHGGLAELLVGKAKLKDVRVSMQNGKLDVIPALANTQFAQELLASAKMKELVEGFRKEYELIVIDCPPVMAVSDAITVSTLVDAVLYMVRWGTTPRALANNAIRQLQTCNVHLAGCVLTRVDLDKQHAYGYGDYGYYYGKYKEYYTE